VSYREQEVALEDITELRREALEKATPISVDALFINLPYI